MAFPQVQGNIVELIDPLSDPVGATRQSVALNNQWSAEQAQKMMDFQREMSNTAHQREMADLRAAGLNPVLSARLGGASTPNGAMASGDTTGTASMLDMYNNFITQLGSASGIYTGKPNKNGDVDLRNYRIKNPKTKAEFAYNAALDIAIAFGANEALNNGLNSAKEWIGKHNPFEVEAAADRAADEGKEESGQIPFLPFGKGKDDNDKHDKGSGSRSSGKVVSIEDARRAAGAAAAAAAFMIPAITGGSNQPWYTAMK